MTQFTGMRSKPFTVSAALASHPDHPRYSPRRIFDLWIALSPPLRARATRVMLQSDQFRSPLRRARAKRFAAKPAFLTAAAASNRSGVTESGTSIRARKLFGDSDESVSIRQRARLD